MARGIDYAEGWAAVAWVAGMGATTILAAGLLWLRARGLRDEPKLLPSYRSAGAPGSTRASQTRALAVLLLVIGAFAQLLYVGLYIELAQWLLGASTRPRITIALFFWVLLVNTTCVGASLYTGWKKEE